MQLSYRFKKLEKNLTEANEMKKSYGILAKKINQRMKDLSAASSLAVLRTLPAVNCHELKGSRSGQLAVDISGNRRIIFEPAHDPLPLKADGGLDWQNVTSIKILEVIDYH